MIILRATLLLIATALLVFLIVHDMMQLLQEGRENVYPKRTNQNR